MIADPPLFEGVVNEIDALASPADPTTLVGAFGTVDGVTAEDAVDSTEVPIPFVALTLNVYASPFVSPVIEQVSVGAVEVHVPTALLLELYAVAVYPVMADPRLSDGSSHEIAAEPLDAVAVTFRGALGAALIAAGEDALEAAPAPAAFVATTLKV